MSIVKDAVEQNSGGAKEPLLAQLRKRRVPAVLGVYLGAIWIGIEFTNFVVERYMLSNHLVDMVLIALVTLIPAVVLFAWYHGPPGRDEWTRVEGVGIPINVLITVAILFFSFEEKNLGRVTHQVQIVNEQGNVEVHEMPVASARRKVVIFTFDVQKDVPGGDWLRHGLPFLLGRDLAQDAFIRATSPISGSRDNAAGLFRRLERKDYGNAKNVPLALQRVLARDMHYGFFIDAQLSMQREAYRVEATLYRSRDTEAIAKMTITQVDPMVLVDELALLVKENLELEHGNSLSMEDLPIREQTSESLEAVEHLIRGKMRYIFENDAEGSEAHLRSALELDANFALAHLETAISRSRAGDYSGTGVAAEQASKHDYRLNEKEGFMARALKHVARQDADAIVGTWENWVALYPDDVDAKIQLGISYLFAGNRIDESIDLFEQVLILQPDHFVAQKQLAVLHAVKGEFEQALEMYDQYLVEFPKEAAILNKSGQVLWRLGRLQDARAIFLRAALLSETATTAYVNLMHLAIHSGDFLAAEKWLQLAAENATDSLSVAELNFARMALALSRGRDEVAYAVLLEQRTHYRANFGALQTTMELVVIRAALSGRAKGIDFALAEMDSAVAALDVSLKEVVHMGHMYIYLSAGQADKANASADKLETAIAKWQRTDLLFLLDSSRGEISELKGEFAKAANFHISALKKFNRSILNGGGGARDAASILGDAARAYRLAGLTEESLAALDQAKLMSPGHPRILLELAEHALLEGDLDRSRELMRQVEVDYAEASANNPDAIRSRALSARLRLAEG